MEEKKKTKKAPTKKVETPVVEVVTVVQPKFEGKITYTKELVKEYIAVITNAKFAIVFFGIALAFSIGGGIAHGVMEGNWYILGFAAVLLILAVTFFSILVRTPKLTYAQMCERNAGVEPTTLLSFFEEKIVIQAEGKADTSEYTYKQIKQIKESRNLIILSTVSKLHIIIEISKLTGGKKEEFLQFLRYKAFGASSLAMVPKQ
ncbi:MAG: YcxB family protein [Firmicutes bacterium]|nr:YcxB family protein [Bacillota bacterium]